MCDYIDESVQLHVDNFSAPSWSMDVHFFTIQQNHVSEMCNFICCPGQLPSRFCATTSIAPANYFQ